MIIRHHSPLVLVCAATCVLAAPLWGGSGTGEGKAPAAESVAGAAPAAVPNLLTGENVSLGGVLFPHFQFNAVYGGSSSERGHELGAGHHDPVADGWTVQGFEFGLSARVTEYFEAFGTYHGYWENEDPNEYDGAFEEWFGKIKNLPGGLEVRGGRYLNRFGFHNSTHLHGWDWMDNYLMNGRFLGDDGQYSIGGEITWSLPTPWTSVVSVSVGEAQVEAHEEHEAEEEEGHEEPLYEGEGALFARTLTTANWTNLWNLNDFHQFRGGFSGAWGDNAWGRTTRVYGAHVQYEWRQHGLEPGGAYLRWRTEAMVRDFEALSGHLPGEDEHGDEHGDESHPGSLDDWGFYSSVSYGHPVGAGILEGSLRFDYVSGLGEAGLAGRRRISPGVTWYANAQRTFFVRGQYNHDRFDGSGSEDSVWLGFGFNWGGSEVR